MPYIQLEVNKQYPTETKKKLVKIIGEVYSKVMRASMKRITVTIRELGEGSVWRCSEDGPTPAAIMMCDIRKGRTKNRREILSKMLIEICNEILELEANQLNIEYTQHSGDEIYHQWMGSLSNNWSPDEV